MSVQDTIVGIVAEYNPFHNGHGYQLECARRECGAATIVAAMSGSFTQRGEAAVMDKWTRARLAVECGVDLVVELPFASAVSSAQFFAQGAVALLATLGVNTLAFGTEGADLPTLLRLATQLETPEVVAGLKDAIRRGRSYAEALTATFTGKDADCARQPNNILALEYLRALSRQARPITPLAIPRTGPGHNDATLGSAKTVSSGSAIRRALRNGLNVDDYVPANVAAALKTQQEAIGLPNVERLFAPLLAILYRATPEELAQIEGVNAREGLQHRILRAPHEGRAGSWAELCSRIATRRYSLARIQRALVNILVRRQKHREQDPHTPHASQTLPSPQPCVVPLAFNERGQALLHDLRHSITIRRRQPSPLEARATDLAALCYEPILPAGRDFLLHNPRVCVQSAVGGGKRL